MYSIYSSISACLYLSTCLSIYVYFCLSVCSFLSVNFIFLLPFFLNISLCRIIPYHTIKTQAAKETIENSCCLPLKVKINELDEDKLNSPKIKPVASHLFAFLHVETQSINTFSMTTFRLTRIKSFISDRGSHGLSLFQLPYLHRLVMAVKNLQPFS